MALKAGDQYSSEGWLKGENLPMSDESKKYYSILSENIDRIFILDFRATVTIVSYPGVVTVIVAIRIL